MGMEVLSSSITKHSSIVVCILQRSAIGFNVGVRRVCISSKEAESQRNRNTSCVPTIAVKAQAVAIEIFC